MPLLIAYIVAALVFAVIDGVWLSVMGPKLYKPVLGELLADKVQLPPAVIFYLLYIAGIVALAISPALKDGPWHRATLAGAILGLVAYGTYDLTNQATLKLWATRLTVLDMSYGAVTTALAATAGYCAARWASRVWAA